MKQRIEKQLKKSTKPKVGLKRLARLTTRKRKERKIQITEIMNERGNINSNFTEVQSSIKQYYEQVYAKLDNLDKMEYFPEMHRLPKLTQEDIYKRNKSFVL